MRASETDRAILLCKAVTNKMEKMNEMQRTIRPDVYQSTRTRLIKKKGGKKKTSRDSVRKVRYRMY